MKRLLSFLLALLLLPAVGSAVESPAGAPYRAMVAGIDIPLDSVTDFYDTYDAPIDPPVWRRYRFYVEDGRRFFYHEIRESDHWPQTEADITASGTVELTEAQWAAFCDLLRGGTAYARTELLDDGDAGPWRFIYWTGGEAEGREFSFASVEKALAFEDFCVGLKED